MGVGFAADHPLSRAASIAATLLVTRRLAPAGSMLLGLATARSSGERHARQQASPAELIGDALLGVDHEPARRFLAGGAPASRPAARASSSVMTVPRRTAGRYARRRHAPDAGDSIHDTNPAQFPSSVAQRHPPQGNERRRPSREPAPAEVDPAADVQLSTKMVVAPIRAASAGERAWPRCGAVTKSGASRVAHRLGRQHVAGRHGEGHHRPRPRRCGRRWRSGIGRVDSDERAAALAGHDGRLGSTG